MENIVILQDALATFVNVILPLYLPKLYTYRVPAEMQQDVAEGKRVVVQFGKRKVYSAVIHSIHHQPPKDYEAKYILSILDDAPIVSPQMMQFWEWMSAYYMCGIGDVMQAALPAPFKLESQTSVTLNPECDINTIELTDKEYLITEALTTQAQLSVDEISEIVQQKNVFALLKGLYMNDVILLSEEVKETYKPKYITCVKLNELYEREDRLAYLFAQLEKKEQQLNLVMAYIQLKHEMDVIEKNVLIKRSNGSESSLKTLIKHQVFELYQLRTDRVQYAEKEQAQFELNESQLACYEEITQVMKEKDVVLLHGITSSGKTHVYVKLIEDVLKNGKQVLFLLPEIALTSQIVARIQKYFGEIAVAFHSRFSQNERVELWQKIQQGEAKVVIGARSAVFLPFSDLGLVIVDEEHETSYKQQEPSPRYHARDAAIFLAHIWKCKTILGSATPSFESYYNGKTGKYALVELKQRFGNVALPVIETANIAEEQRVKTMHGNFTSVLYGTINEALEKNEQVILFQNRRGYAPILECQQCHHVPRCINCDISLTYHKYNDSLKCHYCGYSIGRMNECVACGSHALELKGLGTEKVEDELTIFFPQARVARLDMDAAKGKHGHSEIIRSFESHEADILVGTQMLSKGLDFGAVSAVGVINADQLLFFPDFRAHERAYQLLTQVSGRAGRKTKQGKVIIQTSMPDHHVIREVILHRYDVLYANEIEQRQQFFYPPFSRLVKLVIKHKEHRVLHDAAFDLYQFLYKRFGEALIGPETPYVSRIKNMYIKEILVKMNRDTKNLSTLKQFIREGIMQTLTKDAFRQTIIYADVDPL